MRDELWRRLIKPSAIEGAWVLSNERLSRPGVPLEDVVRLLRSTYVSAGFDFAKARELLDAIPVVADRAKLYRDTFQLAISRDRPPILFLLLQGRDAFCGGLDEDALECFRRAGALDDCPSDKVVSWLDQLAAIARSEMDGSKLQAGRIAERKTLEWERLRLRALNIDAAPSWTSLDDNSAGYDIQSWDVELPPAGSLRSRFIEVKSYAGSSPQFYLTRNEMKVGEQHAAAYFLYVWSAQGSAPLVIPWPELQPYLPRGTDRAQCSEILVRWPAAADSNRRVEHQRREIYDAPQPNESQP